MDKEIVRALESDRLIDITTVGRKTGNPHRIEIGFNTIDSEIYITGMPPKKRDWYANMVTNRAFTYHLKHSVRADIPAWAAPIVDEVSRRKFLSVILNSWNRSQHELALTEVERKSVAQTVGLRIELTVQFTEENWTYW